MRIVIFVLVIVVLAFIAALATGYLDIDQIRGAKAPQLSTTDNGVVAEGGQTPTFDVQTGSVRIGAQEKTVKVPKIVVERPDQNQASATTNNNM